MPYYHRNMRHPPPTYPTPAQCGRLYAIAHTAGLDRDGVLSEILARYGKESTSHLTRLEYEEYCRDLQLRADGRVARQNEPTSSDEYAAMEDARPLRNLKDCRALLEATWPELLREPHRRQLAEQIAQCLDYFRLTRLSGVIAANRLRGPLHLMRKADWPSLEAAVKAYLEGHTDKNERYFLGILRNAQRCTKRAAKATLPSESADRRTETVSEPKASRTAGRYTPPPRDPRPLTPEQEAQAEAARRRLADRKPSPETRTRVDGAEVPKVP